MKKSVNWFWNEFFFIFLLVTFLLSTYFKICSLGNNSAVVTMDQGRDLIDIRHMVVMKYPRLVGPTTSINGVLLGPFWYYFNLVPFVVSGGDPNALAIWQICWYQISAIFIFMSLRKIHRIFASLSTILYLLLPIGFSSARMFWNANSMPLFVGLYFALFFWTSSDIKHWRMFFFGMLSGLAMQIEAAFGIILFPFAFIYFWIGKNDFKKLASLSLGFALTLIPQIMFEMRHGFVMSKIFMSEILGSTSVLGPRMTFAEKLTQRKELFLASIRDSNHIFQYILFLILILLFTNFLRLLIQKKINHSIHEVSNILFAFIMFSFLFYLFFPQSLKVWYTISLSVPFVLILSIFLYSLSNIKWRSVNLGLITITIFLFGTVIHTVFAQEEYLNDYVKKDSPNPSVIRNEMQVIDWIYKNADGRGFKVYSFVPSVYDFSNQYLFWWYGLKKYQYMPNEISYLPGQPEYIKDMKSFWVNTKPTSNNLPIFLIIENPTRGPYYTSWIGNFFGYCIVSSQSFPFNIETRMLTDCKE